MKMLSRRVIATVAATMIAVLPGSIAFAQTAPHEHKQQSEKSGPSMGGMKMDAKMMEEMAAKKKANSARLASLMAQAQTASGDAKVAALAEAVAILVEERGAMQEHCAAMMSAMPMKK